MKLLIVSTRKDLSLENIIEEAYKHNIETKTVFYEDLEINEIQDVVKGYNFCILRDPYNTGEDFSIYLRSIIQFFQPHQVLDYETYIKFPFYEDKLFQYLLFSPQMKMLRTWHFNSLSKVNIEKFPIIVKKRVSSRGRGIFIIESEQELKKFFFKNRVCDYFFQEYKEPKKDIRVIVLGNKVIGSVERKVNIKKLNGKLKVGVKVNSPFELPRQIKGEVLKVARMIKCDFCGIDFLIDGENNYYLLECNISPQFIASEKVLKINIASELIKFIIRKYKSGAARIFH